MTMWQRTLGHAVGCTGVGVHSGATVRMVLRPAPADSGIIFRRTDLSGPGAIVPAHWSNVNDTRLNTSVVNGDGASVRTIEHLMAALVGSGIDNAFIDIDGPEVPVMDGSAAPFVFLFECAGIVSQPAVRRAIRIVKPVMVRDGDKIATLSPAANFAVGVEIEFAAPAIGRQQYLRAVSQPVFKAEISRARTFGFEQEVTAMRAAGLGRGGSLDNAVVVSADGERVLNREGLRYADEFVRHKVLDAIGDLALAGAPIIGRFHGVRTGHALNNRLLHALFEDPTAWRLVALDGEGPALFTADHSAAA
jgi:UDP-3-O-[3-hydroxymyristoyl] N-acetylglucosamine deacetylase